MAKHYGKTQPYSYVLQLDLEYLLCQPSQCGIRHSPSCVQLCWKYCSNSSLVLRGILLLLSANQYIPKSLHRVILHREYILQVFNFANFAFKNIYTQKNKKIYMVHNLFLTDSRNFSFMKYPI